MAAALNTQPYRGTRDFFPEEMSMRTQVFSALYRVIEAYGYTRYDGPILEPIEIYEAKSGHEIVSEQVYRLTDRSGRELAIRPEMTPTVARLIARKVDQLQFPVRWYSHVNCHRYERPQRGRVREHWQINVDIFGAESPQAEVEIFELIHHMLWNIGASADSFVLRVSDRLLVESALQTYAGVNEEKMKGVFEVLDRWEKYPQATSEEELARSGLETHQIERIKQVVTMSLDDYIQVCPSEVAEKSNVVQIFKNQLTEVPLKFDPLIIRAFEYYTATVFEVFDTLSVNKRSLFGGGRYANLVSLFRKDKRVPGIGFGMGDVTLFDFLEAHQLSPQPEIYPQVYIVPLGTPQRREGKALADELRARNIRTVVPLEELALSKALKEASRSEARLALVLGEEESKTQTAVVRDLVQSEQSTVPRAELVNFILAKLGMSPS